MRERGYLEKQGGGVCWHFECSLGRLQHLAVVEHRLEQPVVGIHSLEGKEKAQPRKPCRAPIAYSFCAAWRKVSSQLLVLVLGLKHALGERNLRERGGVWGAVE